jgi:hypothetical protein
MRPMLMIAAALAATLILPGTASAFEMSEPSASSGLKLDNDATRFSDPMERKVLPEISLEAFGGSLGNMRPNYIPEPPQEAPNWIYSSPAFRATR